MASSTAILNWPADTSGRYAPGFFIGAEGDDGEHLRNFNDGWPFSIYRRAAQPGVTDMVLFTGIQNINDAAILLELIGSRPVADPQSRRDSTLDEHLVAVMEGRS